MKLWMEGYLATGEGAPAQLLNIDGKTEFEGNTLMDAYLQYIKESYGSKIPDYVHLDKPVIWGCRVYDNEIDARKSFG